MLSTCFSCRKEVPGVLLLFFGHLHWFSVMAPPSTCTDQYFLCVYLNVSCIFLEVHEASSDNTTLSTWNEEKIKKKPLNPSRLWEVNCIALSEQDICVFITVLPHFGTRGKVDCHFSNRAEFAARNSVVQAHKAEQRTVKVGTVIISWTPVIIQKNFSLFLRFKIASKVCVVFI